MRRSIYILVLVLILASALLSGFGIAPMNAAPAVLSIKTPTEPTPTLPPPVKGVGRPLQEPTSDAFQSCPPDGGGKDVTGLSDADFKKYVKPIPVKDLAKYLSPGSFVRYVKSLSEKERIKFLKGLNTQDLVKYVAGLSTSDGQAYLANLSSEDPDRFAKYQAALPGYQAELYQDQLKDRTDPGNYRKVDFDTIFGLFPTKESIQQQQHNGWQWENRGEWAKWQRDLIYRYEGLALKIDGYILSAQAMGAESANCYDKGGDLVDWHVTFVKDKTAQRQNAMVVEVTPRIRDKRPEWTLEKLNLLKKKIQVRISGWLFFDPEHTERTALGNTRGTLWEIHPVMRIFVASDTGNLWVPLEKCEVSPPADALICKDKDADLSERPYPTR